MWLENRNVRNINIAFQFYNLNMKVGYHFYLQNRYNFTLCEDEYHAWLLNVMNTVASLPNFEHSVSEVPMFFDTFLLFSTSQRLISFWNIFTYFCGVRCINACHHQVLKTNPGRLDVTLRSSRISSQHQVTSGVRNEPMVHKNTALFYAARTSSIIIVLYSSTITPSDEELDFYVSTLRFTLCHSHCHDHYLIA